MQADIWELLLQIVIEGTNRALTATADAEVSTVPEFTGAPEQLWRIEQLIDGTYRIMPKKVPGTDEELVLVSVGDSTLHLAIRYEQRQFQMELP